mgnify:CR=1 FL=1
MKIVNFDEFEYSIECPTCGVVEPYSITKKVKLAFMNDHFDCVKNRDRSFKITIMSYPIIETACEFCKSSNGEYRYGVYVCGPCEVLLHKVKK